MKRKTLFTLAVAVFLVALAGFLLTNRDNQNPKSPSAASINAKNKEYMDRVITESRSLDKIQTNPAPRKKIRAYATAYEMDLVLDTEKKILSGSSRIRIKNDTDEEIRSVVLRNYSAGAFEEDQVGSSLLSNIRDENDNILPARIEGDGTVVRAELTEGLRSGEEMLLSLDFQCDIPKVKDRFGYVTYDDRLLFQLSFCFPTLSVYENGSWNQNPYILSGAESNYTPVSDYSVQILVPSDFTVIATGEEKANSDGRYTVEGKNLREFAMVVGNKLAKSSASCNGTEINSYYYDYDGNRAYNDFSFKLAKESFELYSLLIGDYPYGELDVVSVFMNSAMEYPGLVMIGLPDIKPDRLKMLDKEKRFEEIKAHIPHEVAHQWFYGGVGNDPYNEPWLDEAFAEFLESFVFPVSGARVLEEIESAKDQGAGWPLQAYRDFYKLKHSMVEQMSKKKSVHLPYDSYEKDEYSQYVYQNGAFFLFELEQAMGEAKFFAMLQSYYKTYKFCEVTTEDFLAFVKAYDPSGSTQSIVDEYIR